jgi:hypothetical protein
MRACGQLTALSAVSCPRNRRRPITGQFTARGAVKWPRNRERGTSGQLSSLSPAGRASPPRRHAKSILPRPHLPIRDYSPETLRLRISPGRPPAVTCRHIARRRVCRPQPSHSGAGVGAACSDSLPRRSIQTFTGSLHGARLTCDLSSRMTAETSEGAANAAAVAGSWLRRHALCCGCVRRRKQQ